MVNAVFLSGTLPIEHQLYLSSQMEICKISGVYSEALLHFDELFIGAGDVLELRDSAINICPNDSR